MSLRAATLALLLAAPACRAHVSTTAPIAVEAIEVHDAASFEAAFGNFVALPLDHEQRDAIRKNLERYVLDIARTALDRQDADEALQAMQLAAGLYAPRELRTQGDNSPLAEQAERLYALAASEGRETPAVFCLALMQHFGDDDRRSAAEAGWAEIESWIQRGGEFAAAPGQLTDVASVLEQTVSVFPGPWLVDRLTAHHLRSYQAALEAPFGEFGRALRRRAEFTGYLLARIHLRADDPVAAVSVLEQLEGNDETEHLEAMLEAVTRGEGTESDDWIKLIAYFQPTDEHQLPAWVITQTWGIISNLSRRALELDPDEPFANRAMGRSLATLGLGGAAIRFYERSLAGDEDVFDTWTELAVLYQQDLENLTQEDTKLARARLVDVEAFHRKGAKLWRHRAIEPGLARAYITVAAAAFDDGEIETAGELSAQSLELEPTAAAYDLVGTIEHNRGQLDEARARFETIIDLPFEGPAHRVHWEIAAHLRLAEIATDGGNADKARKHLKAGLQHLNTVLGYRLAESERGVRHLERGSVFFRLGELDLAMTDFRSAASVAPDDPRSYVEPLVLAVEHGYYDAALEVYGRAMSQPAVDESLKLYASLWIGELGARLGRAPDERAHDFIAKFTGKGWVGALASHARGETTIDGLLARAENRGQRAEAYFYEGLHRFSDGSVDAGLRLMREVVATEMMSFFEYEMAQHYIGMRDAPRSARAPITSEHEG